MKQNKLFSAAILLCMIALFTVGWKSSPPATPKPVTITAVFTGGVFPNLTGTFTTTGALTVSGTVAMAIGLNSNGERAHCVLELTATDGTITIHQECVNHLLQGRWEIVSGTGTYANLRGNGPLTMPPGTEAMIGVIY
jgi:hypothetical protein